ncbi:hypothetical protein V7034_28430, partial [Priestia megaterium]|uniref:hypothetical protein n=1 Tax=Priestia megaterium TaxID=1404 RepID=UPI002FFF04D1
MEMDFKLFQDAYWKLKINGEPGRDIFEDLLPFIQKLDPVKDHDIFYPQGIFNQKELNLFFITKFTVTMIEVGNSSKITTWKTNEISSCELTTIDYYEVQLKINFKDGNAIELNSKLDTSHNWSSKFKEKIL